MSSFVQTLLDRGQFKMSMAGQVAYQKWEAGFEAYFAGVPRREMRTKHCRQGWDAGKAVAGFKERLSHAPDPCRDPFVCC